MKPLRIVLAPTSNRPLNIFLGLVLVLAALLVLLALATYHATDPSWNTASGAIGPAVIRNWIGLFGASLSDLLLQFLGISAFFIPLWLCGLGWTWMRSRPGGLAWLRWMGALLALAFTPAVLALLPWRWLWQGRPVAGVTGLLISDLLVRYLNFKGATLVAGVLAAAGIYFASAVFFSTIAEMIQARWRNLVSLHDRWRNWREQRAERRQERIAERGFQHQRENRPEIGPQLVPDPAPMPIPIENTREAPLAERPGIFARIFRRRPAAEIDPVDIPAYKRVALQPERDEVAVSRPLRRPSIWESAVELPAQAEEIPLAPSAETTQPAPAQPVTPRSGYVHSAASRFEPPAASPAFVPAEPRPTDEIAIHERADAGMHLAAVAPKNISGFKLPPSTLLNSGEEPQAIREDELREEARVLVEKCAEFDVRGQIVQINPGPMVTTYEFKPEAGVKYSRVTGLDDDLCLAMRAESILIERMAGKNTVGIQVPNHRRETIHLRDCIESEDFRKAKSRLTIAMGKDINGRIRTADLAAMPHVLIAGSTGSGKSVAINAMIMSLLYPHHPRAGSPHSRRPQARRAGHVRRHSPSLHAHHHRAQAGRQRPAQRRPRDGAPSQAAGLAQRAQHRSVQQALRGLHAIALRRRRRSSSRSPTSSSSSTNSPT